MEDLLGKTFGKLTVLKRVHYKSYELLCECGNKIVERQALLLNGKRTSCGCGKTFYLIGQRFGKLIVVEKLGIKNKMQYWGCICDCGNTHEVHSSVLRNGHITSCGCNQSPNLKGQRFGRLLVMGETESRKKWNRKSWDCLCDCGKVKSITTANLTKGVTKSCGCLQKQRTSEAKTVHGYSRKHEKTSEFRTWVGMKTRCFNPKDKRYNSYGGRGITMCEEWAAKGGFIAFIRDMGDKPSPLHSIERINNEGNYEPSNCKWATREEQVKNKRTTKWYVYEQENITLEDLARKLNTSPETIKVYADKGMNTFSSEAVKKLKLIGERNFKKGFIWKRKIKKKVKK